MFDLMTLSLLLDEAVDSLKKKNKKETEIREKRKQQWLLQKTLQERDKNDRVMPITMKTIMKIDLPSALSLRVM